jgi:DNA-binding YbaB/EbfC family protein
MDIQHVMKQAQEMQERLKQQMARLRVEGSAGGGMVTVMMNGHKQVLSVRIDPEVVSKDEIAMLQDLVVAAINDAERKVNEVVRQQMGGLLSGLGLPNLS